MLQHKSICRRCFGNHRKQVCATSTTKCGQLPVCVSPFAPEPQLSVPCVYCLRISRLFSSVHHRKQALLTNRTLVAPASHYPSPYIRPARQILLPVSSALDVVATNE